MTSAFIFGLLIALMLTGMPISIALGLTVLTFLYTMTQVPIEAVALKLFTGIENFEIMAIPFFILAGNFLTHGGVARRMIAVVTAMIGHLYGRRRARPDPRLNAWHDHLLSCLEERLSAHAEGDLGGTNKRLPPIGMGPVADRDRAWRHLRRNIHADGSSRDERGLRLCHRGLRLSRHDAQGCAEGAARLGQYERHDPLHRHQRSAFLVSDDERADPAGDDKLDHFVGPHLDRIPAVREPSAPYRRQRDGALVDRAHHRANPVSGGHTPRHPPGASWYSHDGQHGSRALPSAGWPQPLRCLRDRKDGHHRAHHRRVAMARHHADLPRSGDLPSRNVTVATSPARDDLACTVRSPRNVD